MKFEISLGIRVCKFSSIFIQWEIRIIGLYYQDLECSYWKGISLIVGFDDGEWVVLTPDGYYNASLKGSQYLKVLIGKDVHSMDDYDEAKNYYRPDLVKMLSLLYFPMKRRKP